jgi:hypothetical protein
MTDEKLMQRIRARWGKTISEAAHLSSVAPKFLAALTANESCGDPNASRFEPAVYRHLCDVRAGKRPNYGAVTFDNLQTEVGEMATMDSSRSERDGNDESQRTGEYHALCLPTLDSRLPTPDMDLRALATSWGLTQVMGYHMVGRPGTVGALQNPEHHYYIACELLAEFAERYGFDVTADFEAMFRCWNTGRPDGKTYDPNYVPNGLRRMAVYHALSIPDCFPLRAGPTPSP